MPNRTDPSAIVDDKQFQYSVLGGVSRTFALTIPQLPPPLRLTVTNAYLLCRIADTIEDDPAVAPADKERFHQWLIDILKGRRDVDAFSRSLERSLSHQSSAEEKELVRHTGRVVNVTRGFDATTREILSHRVAVMCRGMPAFQRQPRRDGLSSLAALDQYCYYVAGVVGQMLTDLFCDYSPHIARFRDRLFHLSSSFGQGLQMTNILKDIWEDRDRGACWLPRDVFAAHGYDLAALGRGHDHKTFAPALRELIGLTHGHLKHGEAYVMLIPAGETGIRRFCLWSLVLAKLTLRNVHAAPGFDAASQVKVSRRAVRRTVQLTSLACRSNLLLRPLLVWSSRGLPLAREVSPFQESHARQIARTV